MKNPDTPTAWLRGFSFLITVFTQNTAGIALGGCINANFIPGAVYSSSKKTLDILESLIESSQIAQGLVRMSCSNSGDGIHLDTFRVIASIVSLFFFHLISFALLMNAQYYKRRYFIVISLIILLFFAPDLIKLLLD